VFAGVKGMALRATHNVFSEGFVDLLRRDSPLQRGLARASLGVTLE